MKEILIPLNFTTTPVLYDSKQSFSASDESSGVLTFTTTANVTGTVASLTLRNASDNANRQTILVERLDINSSPFSYTVVKPLPFGNYEGEITLKKGTQIIASAVFLFGVNSSLSASVLPKLVEAYSLDALVEEVETEVSNLKDAYTLTVSETVKGVNKTESTLQAQENVRYLNEHTRKNNNSLWKAQAEAFALAEENRVIEFNDLVDSAVIEQVVTQEVAEKYIEIEATQANRLLSVESELADIVTIHPNGVDDTFVIQNALDSSSIVRLIEGEYKISSIELPSSATILTSGFKTVIKQLPGLPIGTRTINIKYSDITIGDMTVEGNISTDTDEQQHAIYIRGYSDIKNIKIGNIYGKDIRGDVICVGGLAVAKVHHVRIGTVYVDNVLRNGVSITGGEDVRTEGAISMGRCGFAVCDVEPNQNSQYCTNIHFETVKGRHVAIAGLNENPVGHVTYGSVYLDQDFQDNTIPKYAPFTGLQYGAFIMAKFKSMHAKYVQINNYDYRGLHTPSLSGDYFPEEIVIDRLEQTNCSLNDPSYNAYNTADAKNFRINGGYIILHNSAKYGFVEVTNLKLSNIYSNGQVTYNCTKPTLENVKIESVWDKYVTRGPSPSLFINCDIKFIGEGIGRLTDGDRSTIINSLITVNNIIFPSGMSANVVASTINSIFYSSGIYSPGLGDGYKYPLCLGIGFLWVDSTGKPRLKTSSPTSDSDGTPINLGLSGKVGQRPTTNLYVGLPYFDTTHGKSVWLKQVSPIVWVDASGAVV